VQTTTTANNNNKNKTWRQPSRTEATTKMFNFRRQKFVLNFSVQSFFSASPALPLVSIAN
jgi:hypothetical protein